MLPAGADRLADGNCLFEAYRAVSKAQAPAAASLSRPRRRHLPGCPARPAGQALPCVRHHRFPLQAQGPRCRRSVPARGPGCFPRSHVRRRAVPVGAAGTGHVHIPTAAKLACCSSIEVVEALLGGRLTRKARLAGERGYMSILVEISRMSAPLSWVSTPGGGRNTVVAVKAGSRIGVGNERSGFWPRVCSIAQPWKTICAGRARTAAGRCRCTWTPSYRVCPWQYGVADFLPLRTNRSVADEPTLSGKVLTSSRRGS